MQPRAPCTGWFPPKQSPTHYTRPPLNPGSQTGQQTELLQLPLPILPLDSLSLSHTAVNLTAFFSRPLPRCDAERRCSGSPALTHHGGLIVQGTSDRGPAGPFFNIGSSGDSSICAQNSLWVVVESDAPCKALHASAVAWITSPYGSYECLCRVLHGKALLHLKAAMLAALASSLLAGFNVRLACRHAMMALSSQHPRTVDMSAYYSDSVIRSIDSTSTEAPSDVGTL